MTRDELASALQFQAAELIPIPLEDAVLDFAILGPASPGDSGEPRMHVLLAAVQEATVLRLVAAVEAGGLQVVGGRSRAARAHPSARSHRPRSRADRRGCRRCARRAAGGVALADHGPGAEGIVSFGGGVTAIAVHEVGVPRFVRVLGTGGRELTDAIANELDLPPETAEALKRQLGSTGHDELVARARSSIERPLSVLLDEVRSSIDYYRNQADSSPLLRIVTTGGAAQLPGLSERLSALVGVPVEPARPRRARRARRHRVHRRRAAASRPVPAGRGRPRARWRRCWHGHRPAAARSAQQRQVAAHARLRRERSRPRRRSWCCSAVSRSLLTRVSRAPSRSKRRSRTR